LPVESAKAITAVVSGVSVAADTRATVSFSLANELGQPLRGLPAANLRFTIAQLRAGGTGQGSVWQSYVTRLDGSTVQATTETANTTGASFADNGDGTYAYTFAKALNAYVPQGPTYDGTLTHRVGLELRSTNTLALAASNNAPYTFQPSSGSTTNLPLMREIVDNDTCFACHDRLEFHGGPRTDVQYCVTCHNPFSRDGQAPNNTVDFPILIHKIHMGEKLANGYVIIGNNNSVNDFSHVVFPQDQRNCQTCHQESDADTPQASNWRLLPYQRPCGACHDTVNFQTGENHAGIAASDDQCVTCHGPTSTIDNGNLRVEVAHTIPEKVAGQKFKYNLLGVTNTAPGQAPVIRFSVTDPTNSNAPYNILTDPAFTVAAGGASRLSLNLAWNTADYTNLGSGSAGPTTGTPSQPISINPLTISGGTPATGPDAQGVFTSTSPIPLPATVTGSISVSIDGHPAVDVNADGTAERIAVTSPIGFFASTGSLVSRRDIVNVKKCDDCHNQLSIHGNNRTDNVQVCAACHNPNATDINRRGAPCGNLPTDPVQPGLGPDDQPIDLKYMIHSIHSANFKVCGFGNSVHDFTELGYPGQINNCEGCHNTPAANAVASYYPVDPTRVLATTVDAGADRSTTTDDVAWSPNTALCSGCHTSTFAEAHMLQNGGSKALTKNADGTTAGGPLETCQLCHGPGRVADVKVMHGIDRFEFQAPVNP
jgi:OmcA/MtrC family decaheme c-type cytochrome